MHKIVFVVLCAFLFACTTKESVTHKSQDGLFKEGVQQLQNKEFKDASKTFAKITTGGSSSSVYSEALMLRAYALYSIADYSEATHVIEQYLKIFPLSKDANYMRYLKAMSSYNKIMDIERDEQPALKAKEDFQELLIYGKSTKYAEDAKWKLDYINNVLAGKDLAIGRFYLRTSNPISAVNRFKDVLENYPNSMFIPESLFRMTEVYTLLGLVDEAKKYSSVLGHNYPNSIWYKKSYAIITGIKNAKS